MYEVFDYRTGEVLFRHVCTRRLAVALCATNPGTDFDMRTKTGWAGGVNV